MTQEQHASLKPNEAVIGRAIADPDFRQALVDDPEQALQDAGIQLSPEDMERLTSMSRDERQQMAEQLDTRQSASAYGDFLDYVSNPGSFNPSKQ